MEKRHRSYVSKNKNKHLSRRKRHLNVCEPQAHSARPAHERFTNVSYQTFAKTAFEDIILILEVVAQKLRSESFANATPAKRLLC